MAPLSASASTPTPVPTKGLDWPYYLLGLSALIPFLGVLTGIAAFILGLLHFKRGGWVLLILAVLGFGVTGGVSYFAYYQMFVNRSGTMGTLWVKATQDQLTLLVKDLEFYKLANGHYPAALTDLPADAKKRTFDIMAMNGDFKNIKTYCASTSGNGRMTCNSVVPAPRPPSSLARTVDFPFSKQGVIFATATSPSWKCVKPDLMSLHTRRSVV